MSSSTCIPADCRDLIHALNQRCREQFDRAERLQAELNDIKGSRAWHVFRWLRSLRRMFQGADGGGKPQGERGPMTKPLSELDAPLTNPADDALRLPAAKVSIIIPFKDNLGLLRNCLRSMRRGTYRRIEFILLDNGSTSADMRRYLMRMHNRRGFRVVACPEPFNFARFCNRGVEHAKGQYLLFLNNDIEVLTPDWLEQMLVLAENPQVGVVGAALLYPDGTIQHAGIEVTDEGDWEHAGRGMPADSLGDNVRRVTAVTGACFLMRRDRFLQLGGFDEKYPVTLNDVDLCCRAGQLGWLSVVTPHARLMHYESLSRGYSRNAHQN